MSCARVGSRTLASIGSGLQLAWSKHPTVQVTDGGWTALANDMSMLGFYRHTTGTGGSLHVAVTDLLPQHWTVVNTEFAVAARGVEGSAYFERMLKRPNQPHKVYLRQSSAGVGLRPMGTSALLQQTALDQAV